MPESREGEGPALARVLGLWDATCVVIGAVVGVGIFFTPKDVARLSTPRPLQGGFNSRPWAPGEAFFPWASTA